MKLDKMLFTGPGNAKIGTSFGVNIGELIGVLQSVEVFPAINATVAYYF